MAFNGCPLRCRYCLNKPCWNPKEGKEYSPQALFDEVKIDQLYFLATHGGVTFGGGEPLLQPDFIKAFRELCGQSWRITVETSLNVPFENLEALVPILDGYIVDIKELNPKVYKEYTGKDNALAISNLEWLLQHVDADCIMVRVPHIPDFNTESDVAQSKERLVAMGVKNMDEFTYLIR